MARAKTKATDANLQVPQSDAEAEQMIARLGALQRDQSENKARHDAQVAALEAGHAETAQASQAAQLALVAGLSIWASANRVRLTGDGKTKTVQMASGTILWREGRYSVKHGKLKVEDVVTAIRERCIEVGTLIGIAKSERRRDEIEQLNDQLSKLNGFLRFKVDLNKDAMLAARDVAETIPGVTVPRGAEEFAVEPLASQIREVA